MSTYLASTKTAVLAVQSWGNPIDPQDLPTIFKPFARLRQKADKHNKNSWGLGLAMVQALAKANLGTVSVSSTRESGTTFFVRLPVKEVLLEPRHAKIA